MRYFTTFLEDDFDGLLAFLFSDRIRERFAFGFGRVSTGRERKSILIREIEQVADADVVSASDTHVSIAGARCVRALRHADRTNQTVVLLHSHPGQREAILSSQDESEERHFFRTAFTRNGARVGADMGGSIVFTSATSADGRVWHETGTSDPVDAIKVIGRRFRVIRRGEETSTATFFDRQVRAFGPELQRVLAKMCVGVVGAGGTGSAVLEQLTRLGVGHLVIVDPDSLETSNVSRVYGSHADDAWLPKVDIAGRHARRIGVGARVETVAGSAVFQRVAERLLDCDFVFGCTDDHLGRSVLGTLAVWHYIPVLDTAAAIRSDGGSIQEITGRVTVLFPGTACLVTRNRISSARVRAESTALVAAREAERLRREGYAPELEGIAPAVVAFTSAVASYAVVELLQRLGGFMDDVRRSTEIVIRFHEGEVRSNATPPSTDCYCGLKRFWGLGDRKAFLDATWPDAKDGQNQTT
jgi:molybdopterin/thiamine biosynthesis adenylyltransferase